MKTELKIDVPVQEEEVVEKTLAQTVETHVQTAEKNTFAASEPNQQGVFADQNYTSVLIIEKLAQDLNEHYTNNEIKYEEQGESGEFAHKEEVPGKEVIEEKPDEATTSVAVGPAIEIFAVSPVPAEGQAFMAVVLVDNGNILLGPKVLGSIPTPVTIAVPGQTDLHRVLMQYYRDAGFEVALLLDLADDSGGEKATDTLNAALTIVSEASGILERRPGVLQSDQEVSSAVVGQLAASGHGLLVYDSDMNPALEMATSLGVPAKSIYRNLEQDKGNERAMRRFLDGAARRAQQEGSAITVATPSPNVISALAFCNLQERSSSIIKVALSQALKAALR